MSEAILIMNDMIDEIYYKAVDLLKRMISTPSVSRDEGAVAEMIESFLRDEGCEVERFGNNVYVAPRDYDAALPVVLLNSHIDTVRAVDGWSREPFVPVEEDGRLYGLGSNDAGGFGCVVDCRLPDAVAAAAAI